MIIHAYKYQGAGNDFVILDNRTGEYDNLDNDRIKLLCDRRFGMGGDGLMLLGKSSRYDFSMRYFNSDGHEGTMCGNGGRCLVAFAAHRNIRKYEFEAIDGYHNAEMLEFSPHRCIVKLKMIDLQKYERYSPDSYFLNTGSPHLVKFVENVMEYPVEEQGRYWRHHPDFPGGTNVNFVEIAPDRLMVRTFERGVEAETYACGTGVTASAIAAYLYRPQTGAASREMAGTAPLGQNGQKTKSLRYDIQALGDRLSVNFMFNEETGQFSDIFLTGPATYVYDCRIEID